MSTSPRHPTSTFVLERPVQAPEFDLSHSHSRSSLALPFSHSPSQASPVYLESPNIPQTPPPDSPPSDTESQSAAAIALLGLSMTPGSPHPHSRPGTSHYSSASVSATASVSSSSTASPRRAQLPQAPSVPMQLLHSSAISESGSSSSGSSTGSARMSEVKKRRSSESSEATEDTGRSKRTRGSHGSYGSTESRSSHNSGISGASVMTGATSVMSMDTPLLVPKVKTDGWTDDMKRVYTEAAMALPPSGREQRRFLGDMRGRNELLGLWVTLEVGTYCGRKRISSHSQTLKNHHSTDPKLRKFLTTDGNPGIVPDSAAWPSRLHQLVRQAFASLPNPSTAASNGPLDLANLPVPPITVRVLRKDGTEVDMSLPEAIENDKAEQRVKNRESKPGPKRGNRRGKTATPLHSRTNSSVGSRPSPVMSNASIASGSHPRTRTLSGLSGRHVVSSPGQPYPRPIPLQHKDSSVHPIIAPPHFRAESGPASFASAMDAIALSPSSAPATTSFFPSSAAFSNDPRSLSPKASTSHRSYSHSAATSAPYSRGNGSYSGSGEDAENRLRGDDIDVSGFAPRHQPHAPSLEFLLGDTKRSEEPRRMPPTERSYWR